MDAITLGLRSHLLPCMAGELNLYQVLLLLSVTSGTASDRIRRRPRLRYDAGIAPDAVDACARQSV